MTFLVITYEIIRNGLNQFCIDFYVWTEHSFASQFMQNYLEYVYEAMSILGQNMLMWTPCHIVQKGYPRLTD